MERAEIDRIIADNQKNAAAAEAIKERFEDALEVAKDHALKEVLRAGIAKAERGISECNRLVGYWQAATLSTDELLGEIQRIESVELPSLQSESLSKVETLEQARDLRARIDFAHWSLSRLRLTLESTQRERPTSLHEAAELMTAEARAERLNKLIVEAVRGGGQGVFLACSEQGVFIASDRKLGAPCLALCLLGEAECVEAFDKVEADRYRDAIRRGAEGRRVPKAALERAFAARWQAAVDALFAGPAQARARAAANFGELSLVG